MQLSDNRSVICKFNYSDAVIAGQADGLRHSSTPSSETIFSL